MSLVLFAGSVLIPHLDAIRATLVLPRQYTEAQLGILRKGESYCPIHSSLRPEVDTSLTFEYE